MVFPVVINWCESWTIKKLSVKELMIFNSGVFTLESPLDWKEIQSVYPKGNQSWIFTGRTDAEAETPVLWLPDAKNWLIGKDPDAGKDWRWEEKQTQWTLVWLGSRSWWWTGRPSVLQSMGSQRVGHNWATELNLTDSSSCLEKSHGQSTLAGYSLWGCKESDTTSRLNHPNIWEGLSQTMTNWAWIWANSKR